MEAITKRVEFTDEYKELCFRTWYTLGRPTTDRLIKDSLLPEFTDGKRPNRDTFVRWKNDLLWEARADELDAKAIQLADEDLVLEKAEMLKRQAQNAKIIQDKAKEFLIEEGFDSSASAVNAYFRGTEEERITKGISDLIVKMSKFSDDELRQKILDMLRRGNENDQIIDTESTTTDGIAPDTE